MTTADPLVVGARERIVAHEMAWRVGVAGTVDESEVPVVAGASPLTVLTSRAFPAELLARRARFLQAVGWLRGASDECVPGRSPSLPPEATLADHLAVVATARRAHADSVELATLVAAVGTDVVGVAPADLDTQAWDDFFDALADDLAPGWRLRVRPVGTSRAALEAVSVAADAYFGRRRSSSVWPAARRAVEGAATLKRRWLR